MIDRLSITYVRPHMRGHRQFIDIPRNGRRNAASLEKANAPAFEAGRGREFGR